MRCAVIMPHHWAGGMLNFGILLCNAMASMKISSESVKVSFCVPEGYDVSRIVNLSDKVNLVLFRQVQWDAEEYNYKTFASLKPEPYSVSTYMTYPEALNNALDIILADVWILMTGLFSKGPIMPLKPYIVYAPDFIQRVVPEIYGPDPVSPSWVMDAWQSIAMQRSQGIFVTSKQTGRDAISYAGVSASKIHLLPMANVPFFKSKVIDSDYIRLKSERIKKSLSQRMDLTSMSGEKIKELSENNDQKNLMRNLIKQKVPFFLWVTNITQHKNHERALEALERYYRDEGGRVKCVMCGPNTQWFNKESIYPYVNTVYKKISESEQLRKNLIIVGELEISEYQIALQDAAFLWHNVLYDNGTFSVIEAARLGTRSLVSKYPQMMEIVENFEINCETFDPWDPIDASNSLKRMEHLVANGEVGASAKISDEELSIFSERLQLLIEMAAMNNK